MQKKCIQQIKKSFVLPLVLFMLSFLVGGVTRGKAESPQSRKLCGTYNGPRGKPSGAEVDQPGQPLPPRKNLKNPQKN